MARRASDAFAAKQRRQKIIAIGGGVLLLGLLAFQGPKLWKQMHPSAPPAAAPEVASATPTTGTPTPTAAAPVAAAPTLVAAPASRPASIAGTSIPAQPSFAPAEGQLRTFSTFATKDPFKQQVSAASAATAASPSASAPASTPAPTPTATPVPARPPAQAPTPPSPRPATAASARPTKAKPARAKPTKTRVAPIALIVVNGKGQLVQPKDVFPKSSKVFKLVSLKGNVARIGVVGGSYANGEATMELRVGKKLTLLNTATGDRYVLKLATTKAGGATGFSRRTAAN
jgi:hypothetical protein